MIEKGLELSKKIYHSHPTGFTGAIIIGKRGIGKSSYGLRVVNEVYRHAGMTPNESWEKALDVCLFEIKDVVKFLKKSSREPEPERVALWDDVGIFASSSMYFTEQKLVQQLKGVLDSIRTGVSGLIMTSPTQTGLLGILKSYDDYLIDIKYTNEGGLYRRAIAYQFVTLPSGKKIVHKRFIDHYCVYLPEWVYQRYKTLRQNALIKGLDRLEKLVEEE